MFKPLDGGGRGGKGTGPAGEWEPLLPVPGDAIAAPKAHPKHGRPSMVHTYRDGAGALLGYVLRFDLPSGKVFSPLTFCEHSDTRRLEWRWKGFPAPRPLYGLDRLAARPAAPVVVVEGEKSADAAGVLLPDHVALTSPNGSKAVGKAAWDALAGRRVVIWPDADQPGQGYAEAVGRAVAGVGAASVATVTPPAGVRDGWDAADALADGWTLDRAAALVEQAAPVSAPDDSGVASADGGRGRRRGPPQRDCLVSMAEGLGAVIWRSTDGDAFASIPVGDHVEHWPLRSPQFKNWLAANFYAEHGGAPGAQAAEDALRVMEARALYNGAMHPVFLRVGKVDGAVWLDLGDDAWRAVRVTAHGWEVVNRPPVKFRRSKSLRALAEPEAGEGVNELRRFVNVRSDADFMLLAAWLVGALSPSGPYPILAVNGEQGSSKSTLTKVLRRLIDPNMAPIRAAPRDDRELIIAAVNSWAICLDNLSGIPAWLSDALCRLATGGGFSARELFTDWGEALWDGQRPIILNGIPDLAARPDLADRCILLTLPAIPEDQRRSETAFWADFDAREPFILGALLDAVSSALRHLPHTHLTAKPRLADFALWVTAAEQGLGWTPGEFLAAYMTNRAGAVETTIEADPIAGAICALVADRDFQGTATELLASLETKVSETVRKSRVWPAANKLKDRLRRLAVPLRQIGVVMDLELRSSDQSRTRLYSIRMPERR